MKKIRLSHTLLWLWEQGRVDEAIKNYFHMEVDKTPQMSDGLRIHQEIEDHINEHKRLPDYLPQFKLNNPKPEHTMIVNYNQYFDIKCKMDLYDAPTFHEYKSGLTDSLEYARQRQVPLYFLIDQFLGDSLDRCYIIHYNQYTNKNDWVLVYKSRKMLSEAANWVDSLGPEIYEHFFKEGLL